MLGCHRDEEAPDAATLSSPDGGTGWFRTGDLAVVRPDGYIEIRDRGKDVIIFGGGNIFSVESERVRDAHPAVVESAVVTEPHDKWGEVPVAHVTLQPWGRGAVGPWGRGAVGPWSRAGTGSRGR